MSDQERRDERTRDVLGGQRAPMAPDGGLRILYRCPACHRIWLMEGARVHVELSVLDAAALAAELGADLARLPAATCRVCGAVAGTGELNLDAYDAGAGPDGGAAGLGLSWEGVAPTGAHLLGTAINSAWAERLSMRGRTPQLGPITDFQQCRSWLQWLAELRAPLAYRPLTPADSREMARSNPPGHGMPDTSGWVWRGVSWLGECPPLGGRCLVSLAQAIPGSGEPFSVRLMFQAWSIVARLALVGRIAGEPAQ